MADQSSKSVRSGSFKVVLISSLFSLVGLVMTVFVFAVPKGSALRDTQLYKNLSTVVIAFFLLSYLTIIGVIFAFRLHKERRVQGKSTVLIKLLIALNLIPVLGLPLYIISVLMYLLTCNVGC